MQLSPDPRTVAAAAGITAAIVFGLTLYALQTKYDFTTAGGVLTGVLMGFIIMSFIGIFFPKVRVPLARVSWCRGYWAGVKWRF